MQINYHRNPGDILICDYNTGFIVPEMVKRRPVVVISPRLRRRNGLCTVVPLSTTQPDSEERYHCRIILSPALPAPWDSTVVWVKADMLATVSFKRLDLIRDPKNFEGKRKYLRPVLDSDSLQAIRACVLFAIGMNPLTNQGIYKILSPRCRRHRAFKTLPRAAVPGAKASLGTASPLSPQRSAISNRPLPGAAEG